MREREENGEELTKLSGAEDVKFSIVEYLKEIGIVEDVKYQTIGPSWYSVGNWMLPEDFLLNGPCCNAMGHPEICCIAMLHMQCNSTQFIVIGCISRISHCLHCCFWAPYINE